MARLINSFGKWESSKRQFELTYGNRGVTGHGVLQGAGCGTVSCCRCTQGGSNGWDHGRVLGMDHGRVLGMDHGRVLVATATRVLVATATRVLVA